VSTRVTPLTKFLVIGHRGSPKRFPENTVASFREALRSGADGFETDLRLLADGVPVLFHDDELKGSPIESMRADEVRAWGTDVEPLAALAQFAGRATMVLEVKRGGWEDVLVSSVAGWPDIIVASFDHTAIAELSRRGVGFPLGLTTSGRIVGIADYAAKLGATWLFPNHSLVTAEDVVALHERGVRVVPWTANRERDWNRLHALGCDGLITDHPEKAAAWRGCLND
jgi:glycerophosphoryl diester phosphodiesterase